MSEHRITFSKTGSLAFISHLDFNHCFIRALKKAKLPLKYSEGYNPRPKISFALPLSVGMDGLNEIVDISLSTEMSHKEVYEKVNSALTSEFAVVKVETPSQKMKDVISAEYLVEIFDYIGDVEEIKHALENPPEVLKKSKSGEKMLNIKDMIFAYDVGANDKKTALVMLLSAADSRFLNPELVMKSLKIAIPSLPEDYKVTRNRIIFKAKDKKQ